MQLTHLPCDTDLCFVLSIYMTQTEVAKSFNNTELMMQYAG